jgi:signal transduction histidine kinase
MIARSALEAATRPPWRLLASSWPWRSLAYLLSGLLSALLPLALLAGIERIDLPLPELLGLVLLALLVLLAVAPLAVGFERLRLRLMGQRLPPAAPLLPRLRETGTLRELGYAAVSAAVAWLLDLSIVLLPVLIAGILLSVPLQPERPEPPITAILFLAGLIALPLCAYPITAWAGARAAMTRAILAPADIALTEVLRSRERLVDGFEAERRRIERDLHDGAQQRLVALSMTLGLARLHVTDGTTAADLLDQARAQTGLALTELRELIRGVHPHVLSDRGLAAALRDLAGRSPVPVDLDLDLPGRLPDGIEVTAYYAASEALTNVAKHSGAARARVAARITGGHLQLEITDDGAGGADPGRGTGLTGLADRVAVVGGRVLLSSPPGGPTLVRVELPCER